MAHELYTKVLYCLVLQRSRGSRGGEMGAVGAKAADYEAGLPSPVQRVWCWAACFPGQGMLPHLLLMMQCTIACRLVSSRRALCCPPCCRHFMRCGRTPRCTLGWRCCFLIAPPRCCLRESRSGESVVVACVLLAGPESYTHLIPHVLLTHRLLPPNIAPLPPHQTLFPPASFPAARWLTARWVSSTTPACCAVR